MQARASITPAAAAAFRITVTAGPDSGATLDLDGSEQGAMLVGKSPVCALRLGEPMISRRHFSLEVVGASLRLVDLGSTNGTFVGSMRVNDVFLDGGETVLVGSTTLSVTRLGAPKTSPLPPDLEFGKLVGMSREMRRLYPLLGRLASSDVPVLVEGETGTGKEVLAESLHLEGPRAKKPFVVFDCTSVAPSLVESELFGHEKGAFTGATTTRRGVFEQADGGTLLIDEIGDLDLSLQPKLLRVLERGEVRRVGGSEVVKVDVRVLSATRRDLDHEVQAGRFRDDLYHRLVVTRVELPPLRRRRGDVGVLARHFARHLGGDDVTIPDAVLARWEGARWPGNVRELRNAVARQLAVGDLVYGEGLDATEDDLPEAALDAPSPIAGATAAVDDTIVSRLLAENLTLVSARQKLLESFDRAYLGRVLAAHDGNVTRAAAASGLARRNFQLLRNRYKL
ncbi:MAG: sigma 54-dependent Fis family transcriptional regulator [Deltaproteobacteria bacterium]|nr:sigma 54-dependent Fis family transcriptional regulator [Deltaproteobacteria bacterium]